MNELRTRYAKHISLPRRFTATTEQMTEELHRRSSEKQSKCRPLKCVSLIQRALASLNTHKGAGPDDVHTAILRALGAFIAQPLTDLFNLSLRTASIPDDWRSATVCPIFNKGDREDASN